MLADVEEASGTDFDFFSEAVLCVLLDPDADTVSLMLWWANCDSLLVLVLVVRALVGIMALFG